MAVETVKGGVAMGGSTSSAIEIDAGHHWVVDFLGMQFNMDTLIMTWITMAIVIFLAWLATRKRSLVPHGWQNIMEMMLDWLQGQMKPTLGRYWPVVSGLLFTYFIFLLVANMLGLLPIHHIMSPTSDLNTTAGLAIFSTILVWAIGIHANGMGFFKEFFKPYAPFVIVNLLEQVTRPLTLAFRLFGNILAGEIMLAVLNHLAPVLAPSVWIAFSILIGLIQAFVFTILVTSYLGLTIDSGEE